MLAFKYDVFLLLMKSETFMTKTAFIEHWGPLVEKLYELLIEEPPVCLSVSNCMTTFKKIGVSNCMTTFQKIKQPLTTD